jgi:hypothetical protein
VGRRFAFVVVLTAVALGVGCGGVDSAVRTDLGNGTVARVVALPPAPGNVPVVSAWLERHGDLVLWGASTDVHSALAIDFREADLVAQSSDFGRHWSWVRARDATANGATAAACSINCPPVALSPGKAFRVQSDGEDDTLSYVNWTNDDWEHDSFQHVDLGCTRRPGVFETLWTPPLLEPNDLLLLGACGKSSGPRSMRVVRTTTALDHFDVVRIRGADIAPRDWTIGPVPIPNGLLSVFIDRQHRPNALIVTR